MANKIEKQAARDKLISEILDKVNLILKKLEEKPKKKGK